MLNGPVPQITYLRCSEACGGVGITTAIICTSMILERMFSDSLSQPASVMLDAIAPAALGAIQGDIAT